MERYLLFDGKRGGYVLFIFLFLTITLIFLAGAGCGLSKIGPAPLAEPTVVPTVGHAFVKKWGAAGTGNGQFNRPTGIGIDKANGFVYIADTDNHRVQKFDLEGNFLAKWSVTHLSTSTPAPVFDVAVNASGTVYVSFAPSIQQFNSNGSFIWDFYYSLSGYSPYSGMFGISCSPSGLVYIADVNTTSIIVYDGSGNTRPGISISSGTWPTPTGITTDSAGNIYVVEDSQECMIKYSPEGTQLLKFGSPGTGDSQFYYISGVAVDGSGNIYISDKVYGVSEFNASGQFLGKWGGAGTADGQFDSCAAIDVDAGGYIYTVDSGLDRIQKFAP